MEDDEALAKYDRHKVRSQQGGLVGLVSAADSDKTDAVKWTMIDYRSRTTSRVVISTFAAETSAALDTEGMVIYARAMFASVLGSPSAHTPKFRR